MEDMIQSELWRPTQATNRWSLKPVMLSGVSSTSRRGPCIELVTALSFLSTSSGFVPDVDEDGRGSSSFCSGGSRGPVCDSQFFIRIFSVICRDLAVTVICLEAPSVNCTYTADI